jgi:hypothetical protein
VPPPALGDGLQQHRAAAAPQPRDQLAGGLRGRLDVVAVDLLVSDPVPGRTLRQRHRMLVLGAAELREAVVLADEQHGQAPQRREVHRLVEGAGRHGAVAEERDDHAVAALQPRREGGADGDREPGADDAVGAEHAERRVGDVHGPAEAPADPGGPPHQLGEHAGHVEPLGHHVTVPAVRRGDHVIGAQLRAHADGHRLLADRQVHEAGHDAVAVEDRGSRLELADPAHLPVAAELRLRGDPGRLGERHGRRCSVNQAVACLAAICSLAWSL